jgi:hypothetical protein
MDAQHPRYTIAQKRSDSGVNRSISRHNFLLLRVDHRSGSRKRICQTLHNVTGDVWVNRQESREADVFDEGIVERPPRGPADPRSNVDLPCIKYR